VSAAFDELTRARDARAAPSHTRELRRLLRVLLGRKIVVVGFILIALLLGAALLASFIAPYNPYEQDLRFTLRQPSREHWLGTDALGRDILSRIIYGSQASLAVGLVSVGVGAVMGMMLGVLAGYYGRMVDTLIMRCMDALLAVPPLLLALAIGAALGGGLFNVIVSLGIALIPTYARVMRGQVLAVKYSDYVLASEAIGGGAVRIMWAHILPNCLSPMIVLVSLNLGVAILAEAALSFLGLGIRPPGAAWGAMVSDGYRYLLSNPWLSFAPGVCIMLVVLAFNWVGDGLRDALDPRLRGTL
jgi:ABC-type dipeptide/oligopeptide/nickel transport system permease subunit